MLNATSPQPASTDPRAIGTVPAVHLVMRSILLSSALIALGAVAQMPLPFWERLDSTHVVLSSLPNTTPWPDTLWANGLLPIAIEDLDTIIVDQCCLDPDPPILLARVKRWPTDTSGDPLPLFTRRIDADSADWFVLGEWRSEPDTMTPLTAHTDPLTRYIWTKEGLETQTDHNGTWRPNILHHLKHEACTTIARDSLKLMRCSPHAIYRTTEPSVLLFFVHDRLTAVFQDNTGTGLDTWGYFDRAKRRQVITARAGGEEAIIFSSGEVLTQGTERWELRYREPSIYRGECDCE